MHLYVGEHLEARDDRVEVGVLEVFGMAKHLVDELAEPMAGPVVLRGPGRAVGLRRSDTGGSKRIAHGRVVVDGAGTTNKSGSLAAITVDGRLHEGMC
jgi:hypothetical protein